MSTVQIQRLESEAREQRSQLQDTTSQLRAKVDGVLDKFTIAGNVRDNFAAASVIASSIAFLLGYAITGTFSTR